MSEQPPQGGFLSQLSRRTVLKGIGAGGAAAGVIANVPDASAATNLAAVVQAGTSVSIMAENAKPGSPPSEWESTKSDTILGFTPDFNVAPGATVRFKVKTASRNYRIRIYRIGWYGGNGARRVAEITPSVTLPQTQPDPIIQRDTMLVDCGNWATSASWTVPADAVSGVYYALFERLDVPGDSSFALFVVRSTTGSDVLVQTSDATWQAYNRYGGASLYWANGVFPTDNGGRALKVSYNRPLQPDEAENDFFSTEYALVRFLERNGYDVSYCTCIDAHRDPALIRRSKVFVSSGHDEYWSGPQRANVTAARDAGVHLMFLSGNEVFWRIRYEPSVDGNSSPERTLVCYKETLDNARTDPSSEWTGTWRDMRFSPPAIGAQPENSLTGQLFRCINPVGQDDFSLQVPYEYSRMRFWKNTSVASLLPGTTATLTGSTLGYEWDQVVDDNYRPKGLVRLSRTTATAESVLIDNGLSYIRDTVTHNLSLYRAPSGALVFGAGTVQWAYGLDDQHITDGNVPTDVRIQQATLNLLADMGVQPQTRMSGLVAATKTTDTVPPVAAISSPAVGAKLPVGVPVTISGTATDSGGGRVGCVEVSVDGGTSWRLASGNEQWTFTFTPAVLGTLVLKVRATDDSCNTQVTPTSRTVEGVKRPLPAPLFPVSATPQVANSDDPIPIEIGMRLTPLEVGFLTGVRFYKGANNTGTHVGSIWSNTGVLLARGTFTNETATGWQTVAVPPVAVTPGTTYVASVFCPNGHYAANLNFFQQPYELWPLKGLASGVDGPNGVFNYGAAGFPGSSFGATNYWVDAIFHNDDNRAPSVVERWPAASMQSVATSTKVSATFSEAMNPTSIRFTLTNAAGTAVAGATAYDAATRTLTFTPTAPLGALTTYSATIADATDLAGTHLTTATSWAFSTIGAPGTSPASLWDTSVTPAQNVTETAPLELGTRWRSDVNGTVSALRFYKAPGSPGPHVGHLWDASGTLLATATYTGETASGWQQVNLATPVTIQKDQTYTVSYHCPGGIYSVTPGLFSTSGVDRGQIHAPKSADGQPNGVFGYGAPSFPGGTYGATCYFADVVLVGSAPLVAPGLADRAPAPGLAGVDPAATVVATFDNPITPSTLAFTLSGPSGAVPSAVTFDAATSAATLKPNAPLTAGATYTASVSAKGTNGSQMAPVVWNFMVANAAGSTPATLWTTAAVPATLAADDTASVELGMRFSSDRDVMATAIRFYKGPGNIGQHVGHLWAADGTLLSSVAFQNETATGWQQATLPAPVAIAAGVPYVVSYLAPAGRYSANGGYFNGSGTDRAPLHAPQTDSSSPNGLYLYGAGGFPTNSWNGSNYWVDVVVADSAAPQVVATTPAAGAVGIVLASTVAAVFSEALSPPSISFELRDSSGGLVPGSVAYDAATLTATMSPTAALVEGKTYTASVKASDLQGNAMASPKSWSFTTMSSTTTTLFGTTVPAVASSGDASAVELGVKFRPSVDGRALGVRFYKGAGNTGTHVGHLWSSDGTLLATATFTTETGSGWQQASFPAPVSLAANTTYVVSYYAPRGNYSVNGGFFGADHVSGPLTAPSSEAAGGNGVYLYGSGGFPTGTWNAGNYWVDVAFAAD